jgi:N-acetylglucosamine malate deacetylase 1
MNERLKGLFRPFLIKTKFHHYLKTFTSLGNLSVGKIWPHPCLEQSLGAQRVLVISPHPDDDVLGCGGTLKKCCDNGVRVKVVVMTDGSRGSGTASDQDLVKLRRKEEVDGLKALGCADPVFLDNLDGKLRADRKNKELIVSLLKEFKPDAVLVPSIFENHIDHIESTMVLAKALREHEGDIQCYSYEVWGPLFPNILVDISNEIEHKKKAIEAHWSQITHQNIKEGVLGLNSFRAMGLGKDIGYCEAFYKCSKEEFVKMVLHRT